MSRRENFQMSYFASQCFMIKAEELASAADSLLKRGSVLGGSKLLRVNT